MRKFTTVAGRVVSIGR